MRWSFWRRRQREADLDAEIAFDIALEVEENVQSGLSREQAERLSRRDFGNVLSLKEGIRDRWSWTSWERLAQDLRYGWRTLRKNPLFTAMAVLSLALGVGANTAIYSFMDAILLRSLPVPHPEQLVIFKWHAKGFPAVAHKLSGGWNTDPHTGVSGSSFPYPVFESVRADRAVLSGLFVFTGARLNLTIRDQSELGDVQFVSGGFFSALEVRPASGRWIEDGDDRFGAVPVAVIGDRYWRSRFAQSPGAIGQSILINGTPFTIVGVSAPDFFGVDPAGVPDVFIPLHSSAAFAAQAADVQRFSSKNWYWLQMMGRLRPGIGMGQAQTALAAQFHQLVEGTASEQEKADLPALLAEEGGGGIDSLRRDYSKPLYVLMTLVSLILAIACANIASLLLARATARRREMAVRLSLGAGRLRVVRQLFTESVLLALIGGLFAVPVAILGIQFITWLLANGRATFTLHADLNWHVLAFTFALSLIAGGLFGLLPAIRATKVDLSPALKEAKATASHGVFRHSLIRVNLGQLLVVSQIAISLMLVIAAGLFVRTLSNLNSIELGFNRENVLLFRLNARQVGYKDTALARFYANLRSRLRTIPGVREATLSDLALVSNSGSEYGVTVPGASQPPGREAGTSLIHAGPAFFTTMQIPILLGRELDDRDSTGAHRVAVVNEVFARKYFGSVNPLGRRFGLEDDKAADIEIVGIAKAARYNSLKRAVPPVVYLPYGQDLRTLGQMVFELRTAGDPLALVNAVRQIVHEADLRLPISNVNTQSRQIDQTINQERTFAELCTCFAILALGISCVGLYGTMAYAVARRTSEIGVRMALGAERRRIIWMVLREVCWLAVTGLTIGLGAAWATTRYVESFLFGLKHNDPLALSLSVGLMAAASILAGYAPASRASRIDPMIALRHE
jgi:macrolide transport system ATP-binding/permease protein